MNPFGQRGRGDGRDQLEPAATRNSFAIRREERGGQFAIEQRGDRGLETFGDLQ